MLNIFRHLSLVVGVSGLLAGCVVEQALDNLADFEERSFTLTPELQGIVEVREGYTTGVCYPGLLNRSGAQLQILQDWLGSGDPESSLLVGYESQIARGQDPFACNNWSHAAYQASPYFNTTRALPAGAVVQRAVLRFSQRRVDAIDRGVPSEPCNYVVGEALRAAPGPFSRVSGRDNGLPSAPTRPERVVSSGGVDVTRTVANWVSDARVNNGFVIEIAAGAPFAEHDEPDDHAYCASWFSDFQLEITALVPPAS
ncbi:MAG: hypothetical protein AAF674_20020 [Pseudomonadota bacterium]